MLRQKGRDQLHWQAHDVGERAPHLGDELPADSLDRVTTGLVEGLTGGHISLGLRNVYRSKHHAGADHTVGQGLATTGHQAISGEDRMLPTGESQQHLHCPLGAFWLSQRFTVDHDGGIRPEDDGVRAVPARRGHCLVGGQTHDHGGRRFIGESRLRDACSCHGEIEPGPAQQYAAPGRARGQYQRSNHGNHSYHDPIDAGDDRSSGPGGRIRAAGSVWVRMKAMRVHQLGDPERLTAEDMAIPEPGLGQVRIRVEAIGVNYADILMVAGRYQLRPELPFSPGFEIAGTIDGTGPGVVGWTTGTRAIATPPYGGYAELVVVPVASLFALPPSVDAITAAAATVTYGTSYHALTDRGGLESGQTLLVTGASGGVGGAALQIGKLLGAIVIGAVGSDAKESAARNMGADDVVRYDRKDPSLHEQLEAVAGRGGLDVIFDPVGGDIFDQCVRALAPNGRLLVVGFAAGRIPRLPTNLLLLKESAVLGVFWGAFREREPDRAASQLEQIWDWIHAGDLLPPPVTTYPLESAAAVLSALASRRVIGKVVLLTAADQPTGTG